MRDLSETPRGDVAILGWGARLPGANGVEAFARLLAEGRGAVGPIGTERWDAASLFHPDPTARGAHYAPAAGLVDDVWGFDAGFFGISPREAAQMDPQQRLLLEVVQDALDDAGLTDAGLSGSRTGVFVGAASSDHYNRHAGDLGSVDARFMTGNTLSLIANRISYHWNLAGPSLTADTACASGLTALHLARRAIEEGECDTAIVGAVNALLAPLAFVGFSRARMLSPTGRCRPFSAEADGYVRAEGAVATVLRRADLAHDAGDRTRATLITTGIASEGRTVGLSHPSAEAQRALLAAVRERAGVHPDDVAFVEAHGPGTPVGDPIEAEAIARVYATGRSTPLPIGSAKGNVGHLEPAAGLVGLLKAQIALESNVLPASLHAERPSPAIDFAGLNLSLAARPVALDPSGARVAAVSAFGFGGATAHALIRAPEAEASMFSEPEASAPSGAVPRAVVLSAASPASLSTLAGTWAARLDSADETEAARLAREAAWRRDLRTERLVALGDTPAALAAALARAGDPGIATAPDLARGSAGSSAGGIRRVGFAFSGNGAQWVGMGRAQRAADPAFADTFARVVRHVAEAGGPDLAAALDAPDLGARLARSTLAQPMLFAFQVALVESLVDAGLVPVAVAGHSLGEVAAAWCAGALSLDQAAHLVVSRARAFEALHGRGGMAGLGAACADAEAALADFARVVPAHGLGLAADNGPASTTVAGPVDDLDAFLRFARKRRIAARKLDVAYPYHSAAIEALEARLRADLAGLTPTRAAIGYVSATRGRAVPGEALDADYWWENAARPVRFREAVAGLVAKGCGLIVEIGPRPILQSALRDSAAEAGGTVAIMESLDARHRAGWTGARVAAEALCRGAAVDLGRLVGPRPARAAGGLPAYPWDRETLRAAPSPDAVDIFGTHGPAHPLLGRADCDGATRWRAVIDTGRLPWLADHRIAGRVLMPATAFAEIALAAGRVALGPGAIEVIDLDLRAPLVLAEGARLALVTTLDPATGALRVESRPEDGGGAAQVHALAILRRAAGVGEATTAFDATEDGPAAEAVYAGLSRLGLDYGPGFRRLGALRLGGAGAEAQLSTDDADRAFALSPMLADAGLHALPALLARAAAAGAVVPPGGATPVPMRIGRLTLHRPGTAPRRARLCPRRTSRLGAVIDLDLLDDAGQTVAALRDLRLAVLTEARNPEPAPLWRTLDVPVALPVALPGRPRPAPLAPERAEALGLVAATPPEPGEGALIADALARRLAFDALGAVGEHLDFGTLPAEARALAATCLAALAEDGLARHEAGGWTLTETAPDADAATLASALVRAAPDWAGALPALLSLPEALSAGAPLEPMPPTAPPVRALWYAAVALVEAMATGRPAGTPLDIALLGAAPPEAVARIAAAIAPSRVVRDPDGLPRGATILAVGPSGEALARIPEGATVLVVEPSPGLAATLAFGGAGGVPDAATRLAAAGLPVAWTRPLASADVGASVTLATKPAAEAMVGTTATALEATVVAMPGTAALAAPLAGRLGAAWTLDPAAIPPDAPRAVLLADGPPCEAVDAVRRVADRLGAGATLWLVGPQARTDATGAALAALARALANEQRDLTVRHVALAGTLVGADPDRLAALLRRGTDEPSLTLGPDGTVSAPRVVAAPAPDLLAQGDGWRLDRVSGMAPAWTVAPCPAPGPGEVEIAVEAAGLNFRDVMWAQGALPEEALEDGLAGPTLGLEAAGRVLRVGSGVDLAPGTAVLAVGPAALASRLIARADCTTALPEGLSMDTAAVLGVAYATALHALEDLARLAPGERVLIHAGAGGVGLAALHVARAAGARVLATAGTPAKRRLLRALGAEAVFDSRSLAFADSVMAATDGRGVDVVLNALSGEAMVRSVECLAPFGRFVELGKRDFFEHGRLPMRPLRRNIAWFGVDLDRLMAARSAEARDLLDRVTRRLADDLPMLPVQTFEAEAVAEAFRMMRAGGHIGRIAVRPPSAPPRRPAPRATLRGAWLVVGGLSGLGLATARRLVERGATALWLTGRRGRAEDPAALDALCAEAAVRGARIETAAADVADEAAMAALLARIEDLVGVVHAAGVLDDGALSGLDATRAKTVIRPKIDGARGLDRLTRREGVVFVAFSSLAALVGNPGQSAYAAANAGVEAVVRARRAAGHAALAVAWGPIADAGAPARDPALRARLEARLGRLMTAGEAMDALDRLLAAPPEDPVVAVAPVDWPRLAADLPSVAGPVFERLDRRARSTSEPASAVSLDALVAGRSPAAARDAIATALAGAVGAVLRQPAEAIDPARPLADLGMDSLMAAELNLHLEERFGTGLDAGALADGASVASLARRLAERTAGSAPAAVTRHLTGDLDAGTAARIRERAEHLGGMA